VFRDIATHAANEGESAVKIVLLGDFFDLIHTDFWLREDDPAAGVQRERADDGVPWGVNVDEDKLEANALKALRRIVEDPDNAETFRVMRSLASGAGLPDLPEAVPGESAEPCPDVSFEFIYVPGNHDRLCNELGSLRVLVSETLPVGREETHYGDEFGWELHDPDHRVVAGHGHLTDEWNRRESGTGRSQAPIGDVITAMFVSKLPFVAQAELEAADVAEDTVNRLVHNLHGMFDVRPYAALGEWIFHMVQDVSHDDQVREALEKAVYRTLDEFLAIPAVKAWKRAALGRRLLLGLVPVLKGNVLLLLKILRWELNRIYENHLAGMEAAFRQEALRLVSDESRDVDHVVFGHSHRPAEEAIRVDRLYDGDKLLETRERLYLNTGTWRPRFERTHDRRDFVSMKGLTYVIVYSAQEGREPRHRVETWTGMLKDEDVHSSPAGTEQ
jgi:UDP-2,3-diacylglucosamine pyrophosphatase LpxH